MILILVYIIISILLRIIFLTNPLSLSLFILFFRILLSVNLGIICYSWFSFIVFLIYVRGIIVIFSYFVVLQPNQRFNLIYFFFFFFFFLIILIVYYFGRRLGLYTFKWRKWFIRSVYSVNRNILLLFIGFLLLLVLLSIVKITFINLSSLRPFIR